MKAGVEMVITLLNRDSYYTAKFKQALIVDQVAQFTDAFEELILKTGDVKQEVEATESSDAGFPTNPPFDPDEDIPF